MPHHSSTSRGKRNEGNSFTNCSHASELKAGQVKRKTTTGEGNSASQKKDAQKETLTENQKKTPVDTRGLEHHKQEKSHRCTRNTGADHEKSKPHSFCEAQDDQGRKAIRESKSSGNK